MIEPTNGDIWKLNTNVICVNPANPDDKMEFKSVEALNQKLFDLKAQVERLTKAGDQLSADVLFVFGQNKDVDDWHAAKEGKQS